MKNFPRHDNVINRKSFELSFAQYFVGKRSRKRYYEIVVSIAVYSYCLLYVYVHEIIA